MRCFVLLLLLVSSMPSIRADDLLPGARRILFLGDSITHSGQYVDGIEGGLVAPEAARHWEVVNVEGRLVAREATLEWEVVNVGLPSETVSGLSEDGHADGKFPRPDLHERLDRVLAAVKPDVIFACYGMNDGIYLPLDEERFARFRSGIELLRSKAAASGAQVIHLTPPVFDAEAIRGKTSPDGKGKPFEGYDQVLTRYSEWLLAQRKQGWVVIDIHGPMRAALDLRRQSEPDFRFANDGVHPSDEGHLLIARSVIRSLGGDKARPIADRLLSMEPPAAEYRKLIRERSRLLTDAWLSHTGHKRPGMGAGLPLGEAQTKATALTEHIREFLAAHPELTAPPSATP